LRIEVSPFLGGLFGALVAQAAKRTLRVIDHRSFAASAVHMVKGVHWRTFLTHRTLYTGALAIVHERSI
jgi:hypothetical protein